MRHINGIREFIKWNWIVEHNEQPYRERGEGRLGGGGIGGDGRKK